MGQSSRALRGPQDENGADDVKRQVDSDDNYQKPIYQLVNVKNGGGKLVDIIKTNAKGSSGSFGCSRSIDAVTSQKQIDSMVSILFHLYFFNNHPSLPTHIRQSCLIVGRQTNT